MLVPRCVFRSNACARLGWSFVVVSLIVGLLTVTSPSADRVVALEPPDVGLPTCSVDENGVGNAWCRVEASISDSDSTLVDLGSIVGDGAVTVAHPEPGIPICGSEQNGARCLSSGGPPSLTACIELVDNDRSQARDCVGGANGLHSFPVYEDPDRIIDFGNGIVRYRNIVARTAGGDFCGTTNWTSCELTYNAPRPDRLKGPTFFVMAASWSGCVTRVPSCEQFFVTQHYVVRVVGDLAPIASFDIEDVTGLSVDFENTSIPFPDATTTYRWAFGDGATSTSTSPRHLYDEPGLYSVNLTMEGRDGETRSTSRTVDLREPGLEVDVFQVDGPGDLAVGDRFTLQTEATAVGTAPVRFVEPDAPVFVLSDNVEFDGSPPTAAPVDLAPNTSTRLDVPLRVTAPGPISVTSTWDGLLDDGSSNSWSGTWTGLVSKAVCSITQSGPGGGAIRFVDDTDGTAGRTWSFSDGTTSTARIVNVEVEEPGTFFAALTTTDGDVAHCSADVAAPELTGEIRLLDADTGNERVKFERDEEFVVEVEVGATSDGVGSLFIDIDASNTFAGAPILEVRSGPTPPIPDAGGGPVVLAQLTSFFGAPVDVGDLGGLGGTEIEPGRSTTHRWTVAGTEFGRFRVFVEAFGVDASGAPIATLQRDATGRIGGELSVELAIDPSEIDLETDVDAGDGRPEPEAVVATLTVTNPTSGTIDDITLPDDLDISELDLGQTGVARMVNLEGPLDPETGEPAGAGPFSLGPSESKVVLYRLEVRDEGRFSVRSDVTIDAPGGQVLEQAFAEVTAGESTILAIDFEWDTEEDSFVDAGRDVRFLGSIENLSATETVTVDLASMTPTSTGNARPYLVRPLDAPMNDSVCGYFGEQIEIEPGERFLIHGGATTQGGNGTRARLVTQPLDASVMRRDEALGADVEVALEHDEIRFTTRSDRDFSFRVDDSVEMKEWSTVALIGGFTVGTLEGGAEWVGNGLAGIADLITLAGSYEAWAAGTVYGAQFLWKSQVWYVQNWLLRTPSEKIELVKELSEDLAAKAVAAGQTLADVEVQRQLVEALLPGWFDDIVRAYETNDAYEIGRVYGRGWGNVIPEVVTCLPLGEAKYVAQFEKLAKAKAAKEAAKVAEAARLGEQLNYIRRATQARALISNGSKIDEVGSVAFGVGRDAYRKLLEYAEANQLLITVRDRGVRAIERLQELGRTSAGETYQLYIEKMEHMKLKNVTPEIDEPLGYLAEHSDIVVFKKPITDAELETALAGITDPLQQQAVRDRHAKRSSEWKKYLDLYRSWEDPRVGFPSGFRNSTNGAAGVDGTERLPFRLRKVTDASGEVIPSYFIPEVQVDGHWRGFTGDLDIIDIRHQDGRSLGVDDATRVYSDLNRLDHVNLRHGDTMHWLREDGLSPEKVFEIKVDQLADYFVGGPDKALQFAPDGARAVQLDPGKTVVMKGVDAADGGRATYATWVGGHEHWISSWAQYRLRQFNAAFFESRILAFLAPAHWALRGDCQVEMDREDGTITRPSSGGGADELETFGADGWVPDSAAQCSDAATDGSSSPLQRAALQQAPLVRILPQSALAALAIAGDDGVVIHDLPSIPSSGHAGDWFEVGDTVLIDPGSDAEEASSITAIEQLVDGSLRLRFAAPLRSSHPQQVFVTLAKATGTPVTPVVTTTVPPTVTSPPGGDGPGVAQDPDPVIGSPGGVPDPAPTGGLPSTGGASPTYVLLLAGLLLTAGLILIRTQGSRTPERRDPSETMDEVTRR